MDFLQALILAIIEGLTEFLPISSTGHMIIASTMMGIASDPFTKLFTVSIQLGAILSVVIMYYRHFFKSINFYITLIIAFIPTAILGLFLKKHIDGLLENVVVVAISLLAGGLFLLFVDKWFARNEEKPENEITPKKGIIIGIFQSISMIPGISRSAATIVGGLTQKLDRKTAAEFSFFLAVPTMFAATVLSLWDDRKLLMEKASDNMTLLLVGNIVAFVVAMLAIRFFINLLKRYGFRFFGYYRIALGLTLLILIALGYDLQIQ